MKMRERIYVILNKVIIDFDGCDGDNLIESGLLDSVGLLDVIAEIEEEFSIEIPAEKMTGENFASISDIEKLILEILESVDGK